MSTNIRTVDCNVAYKKKKEIDSNSEGLVVTQRQIGRSALNARWNITGQARRKSHGISIIRRHDRPRK